VGAAKTRQNSFERAAPVPEVLDEKIFDDEVAAKEREVAGLKAEIAQTEEMLRKMGEEMKDIKSEALRAAEDARRIVTEHEKLVEPKRSLPGSNSHHVVKAFSNRSVANSTSEQLGVRKQGGKPRVEHTENVTESNRSNISNASISGVAEHSNISAKYGSEACPCIGFDNLQGEAVTLIDGKMVKYPADLGSSCNTWDDGFHPQCTQSGKGEWCAQPWCYVDPRQCKVDVLPTMSTYMPSARYKHMPLFYSYSTCGSSWGKEAQVAVMGSSGCRCVGVNNMPGSLKFDIEKEHVLYPAEAGGSCDAWDLDNHPQCAVTGTKPEWCNRRWCFVDPCSCSVSQPPKVSTYVNGTMQGKSIYYSYETCGNQDMFTATYAKAACLEKTKDACNKNAKCLWSGHSCLGKELVDKDACLTKTTEEAHASEGEEKSFAQSSIFVVTGAVLSLLL